MEVVGLHASTFKHDRRPGEKTSKKSPGTTPWRLANEVTTVSLPDSQLLGDSNASTFAGLCVPLSLSARAWERLTPSVRLLRVAVVKAKVHQEFAVRPQLCRLYLIDVKLAGARYCALESPRNGVAANLEHTVCVSLATFGRITLDAMPRVFERLKGRNGARRQWDVTSTVGARHGDSGPGSPTTGTQSPPGASRFRRPDDGRKQRRSFSNGIL